MTEPNTAPFYFNVGGVADFRDLWVQQPDKSYRLNAITEYLIFKMMDAGITKITARNLPQVRLRLRMMELIWGPMLTLKDPETGQVRPVMLTLSEIARHIGLKAKTTALSNAQFQKRILESIRKEAADQLAGETRAFQKHVAELKAKEDGHSCPDCEDNSNHEHTSH